MEFYSRFFPFKGGSKMLDLFKSFVDLGAIVVLPILIFIFGVALGTKPKKSPSLWNYGRDWFCRLEHGR